MNAINLLLACLGGGITLMVAIGMVLLTPRGVEPRVETSHEQPPAEEQPRPREQPQVGLGPEVAPHV